MPTLFFVGSGGRIRTDDLLVMSQMGWTTSLRRVITLIISMPSLSFKPDFYLAMIISLDLFM